MVRSMMDMELINRLYPILATAAENKTLLDLQEILRRFSFDVVFQNLFGYDLQFLSPGHVSNTTSKFADAFTHAVQIGSERYVANISALPILWRVKRFLNIGSEKQFKMSVNEARGFIGGLIKKRKEEKELVGDDVLTRLLISGWTDEKFVLDLLICLLLAGQEAISTALTWFFWVISANPEVERELVKEILSNGGGESNRDEVNGGGGRCMGAYTRASLSECLRLYPPVPVDTKEVMADDVWPDGTIVKKGMKIVYHIYAMGRSKEVWGSDFAEFRPERWLERDGADGKMWRFVARGDSYSYPVFQAGPRICLGREIAFMQMEKVVAGVLSQFRVVPAVEGFQPEYISYLTSKMKGGFPVRLERRSKGDL
ncbi:hypothetical protein ACH5RR_014192 [Cinchona calisaya]|uniref:Cytochrome P450 n=1 Tax=Cinchona calisaya TaxID=153742 RepID=A0ABD3A5K1_9GENT